MTCIDAKDELKTEIKLQHENNTTSFQPLLFGVDSKFRADDLLQNNIDLFEWVTRNKVFPLFWGRNIDGENSLTKEEIAYIHDKGSKIVAMIGSLCEKKTESDGIEMAKYAIHSARHLDMPIGSAIFMEVDESESISHRFIRGYAETMLGKGYTPGLKASSDAHYSFGRAFSRGMQHNSKYAFEKCLIWATSPTLAEYNGITTSHLVHPDNWRPFAPSSIARSDIAIWQYGVNCHSIYDDSNVKVAFNVNILKNNHIIVKNMF